MIARFPIWFLLFCRHFAKHGECRAVCMELPKQFYFQNYYRVLPFLILVVVLLSGCTSGFVGGARGTGRFDTVVIDAGHGGFDRGAKPVSGVYEKDLALDTATRLASQLRQKGLHVVETRTGDYFVTLDNRVAVSNRLKDSIFVSIHYNWARRKKASGIETFYLNPNSARLASRIQSKMVGTYRCLDRGIKSRKLYVLRNNKRPAVLCELGFVSNRNENAIVQSSKTRQKLADSIASAILAERASYLSAPASDR